MENGTKVLGNFDRGNCGQKFSFRAASGSDGLCGASIGNDTRSEGESIVGSGMTIAEIVGMGSVNKATKLERRRTGRERGKYDVEFSKAQKNVGKGSVGSGMPVDYSPVNDMAKIEGDTFEALIVELGGNFSMTR